MNAPGKLLDEITHHLARELGDRATATALARLLGEEALSWRMPEIAASEITIILAFTFGNRMQPNGNRTPGPVNEALADVAVRLHSATGAPVYAQWEVAEATASRISPDRLFAIYPSRRRPCLALPCDGAALRIRGRHSGRLRDADRIRCAVWPAVVPQPAYLSLSRHRGSRGRAPGRADRRAIVGGGSLGGL
jgi:hypothetical protein